MTRQRRYSLGARLAAAFATAGLAVLAMLGGYLYQALSTQLRQRDDIEIADKLKQVTQLTSAARTLAGVRLAAPAFHETLLSHSGLFVGVFDASGAPIVEHSEEAGLSLGADIAQGHRAGVAYACAPAGIGSAECIHGAVPLGDGNRITIAIARSADDRSALLRAYCLDIVAATVIGALLVGTLGYLITRLGLRPVRNIGRQASQIEASSLHERLDVAHGPAELVDIGASVNRMLDRLERAFARLSRFSSDVAHDMRTPLANIISASQIILSRDRERADYEALIESNIEECERLQRMLDDMLFLARSDHATQHLSPTRLDARDVLGRIAVYYQALADEKNLRIRIDGTGTVLADALLLRRAAANLLSNAVEHAAPGSAITIEVAQQNEVSTIRVENSGATIPPAHLENIFERFYRVDPSRQGSAKNAGLGLAIVRSIMELHRGSVDVTSRDGLTAFTLRFPREASRHD
jgi:two-component system heavy metal sensor histidine kinase CusS